MLDFNLVCAMAGEGGSGLDTGTHTLVNGRHFTNFWVQMPSTQTNHKNVFMCYFGVSGMYALLYGISLFGIMSFEEIIFFFSRKKSQLENLIGWSVDTFCSRS